MTSPMCQLQDHDHEMCNPPRQIGTEWDEKSHQLWELTHQTLIVVGSCGFASQRGFFFFEGVVHWSNVVCCVRLGEINKGTGILSALATLTRTKHKRLQFALMSNYGAERGKICLQSINQLIWNELLRPRVAFLWIICLFMGIQGERTVLF